MPLLFIKASVSFRNSEPPSTFMDSGSRREVFMISSSALLVFIALASTRGRTQRYLLRKSITNNRTVTPSLSFLNLGTKARSAPHVSLTLKTTTGRRSKFLGARLVNCNAASS
eukprot:Lithocolla_globosa_v1_NODE_499_length_3887_cov_7.353079.p3 type:complete len:113 gc:universal NODE_499_length_3887_cov_7.353079:873-1211(+)